jgi:hypothetical protein
MRIEFPSGVLTSGAYDPFRFILKDLGAGGATLYDITLPDGVTAFQHACDPRDKRTSKGYVNKSNALPPDCVPGSANGFQKLTMRWTGVNDLRIQIKNTTFPAVVGPIQPRSTTAPDRSTNATAGWAKHRAFLAERACAAILSDRRFDGSASVGLNPARHGASSAGSHPDSSSS